jgi:hypothetical protein
MCYYITICIITSIKAIFSSNISSLSGICSNFSSNIAILCSNIAHLGKNVVLLDICKVTRKRLIPKLLQQLTLKIGTIPCLIYCHPSTCILLTNMAQNMQVYNLMKNKPILNLRGV